MLSSAADSHAGLSSIFVVGLRCRHVMLWFGLWRDFKRLFGEFLDSEEVGHGPGLYSGDWRGGAALAFVVALLDDLP
jgi:hypothetical protein